VSCELYLLDLDGLLVRTEELHFLAYRRALAARGLDLDWDFPTYCLAAHYGPEKLQAELARALPGVFAEEPWEELFRRKSAAYLAALESEPVELQPGAAALLSELARRGERTAVVTNSTREQTFTMRRRLPALASVPLWIAREDYRLAKPDPEAYLAALARLGGRPEDAVGLEDSPRGVQALGRAGVEAFWVTSIPYPVDAPELRQARRYPDLLAALPDLMPDGGPPA
jgi:HAD superfamily hydrolase (TIGR01509 family)